MVISIPPHHMTMRALEWLSKAEVIYGTQYDTPINEAACDQLYPERMVAQYVRDGHKHLDAPMDPKWDKQPKLIKDWTCNVEDMRALWLSNIIEGMDYTVQYHPERPANDRWVKGAKPIIPSCTECRALMDQALSNAPMKYGQYLRYYRKGDITANNFRVPNHGVRWTFDKRLVEQCPKCKGTKRYALKEPMAHQAQLMPDMDSDFTIPCPACQERGYTQKGFQLHRTTKLEQAWGDLQDAKRYMMDTSVIILHQQRYQELREEAEVQALASEFEILEGPNGYTARRRRASR